MKLERNIDKENLKNQIDLLRSPKHIIPVPRGKLLFTLSLVASSFYGLRLLKCHTHTQTHILAFIW